ncbi:MAG TPA: NAD-dependent epimerase/dehydratase family protein, partial [Thermoanaerobaculia bacterium]|nr:NAD-dependent epimerase/dehydratase family protein [Thermoanaerobaculia bacterium]
MSVTQTDFSGAHVLVTGGAGFIGSHLVDAYLARGSRVTVLDDLSTGTAGNLAAGAELVEGDIRDTRVLDRLFRERFDLVNHHAAQIDVRRSVSDPAFDAEVNVVGSLRLLERAAAAGTGRFIFASSGGAIYGEPQAVPQTEDHPAAPISPYGCAKLSIEHYLHYYREVRGLHFTALR